MSSQRQIWLCREGLAYIVVFLAVLIGAVSRQLNLLMLLGSMLAGPLLFSLVYGRLSLRRLTFTRKLPPLLHAGGQLHVDVALANQRRWFGVWAIRVDDFVARDGAPAADRTSAGVFYPRIPAGQTSRVTYEGRLPLRGRYRFGPARVSTRFPLGLVRHTYVLDDAAELVVHPRLGRLSRNWAKMIRTYETGGQRLSRRGLLEADFYGLREWRPGDSRRWIHWRTSARRGGLVVRQFEQRRSENVAVLVDLWQPRDPSDDELARVETAVSLIATLISEMCRKPGAQLTLQLAAAESLHCSGAVTPLFLREQMDALALVRPHHADTIPAWLGHALAVVPVSTPTFVVSTRPVEWEELGRAAAERDTELAGRKLHGIDVGDNQLPRYFQL